MTTFSIILVIIIAFISGVGGILEEFQTHQPLITCTLIGLVTGNLEAGIILGGSLQMIALGWVNIGAAVAPDAAFASVASAIILSLGNQGVKGVSSAIAIAIPLAVAGLFLTMLIRTVSVPIIHMMDRAAETANFKRIERLHMLAMSLQGFRVAIPAAALLFIPASTVQQFLESMPTWLMEGMAIGGGMVVAVGYAMVLNMMSNKEIWPFFIIGFIIATLTELTLIGLGALGIAAAMIYLNTTKKSTVVVEAGNSSNDELDSFLNDI